MEGVVIPNSAPWRNRSVWVSGHTGFKGGWLTHWLHLLGADVHGYALDPMTEPNLFESARVGSILRSDTRADVRNLPALRTNLRDTQPEIVFHLAAQPIVRESYSNPLETFAINTLGTANVLEACRSAESIRAIIVVTTDKVYAARDDGGPFTEDDPLGGHDPYSASKAAAELVTSSFRASYFAGVPDGAVNIASVRAGNVIGGGDWSDERLIPDCIRAFETSERVRLRYPHAIRPWQHVLDPLAGYLRLADRLLSTDGFSFARPWNFGPDPENTAEVHQVASLAARLWGHGAAVEWCPEAGNPHETAILRLDNSRAHRELDWEPRWSLERSVEETVRWYSASAQNAEMGDFSRAQILSYMDSGTG